MVFYAGQDIANVLELFRTGWIGQYCYYQVLTGCATIDTDIIRRSTPVSGNFLVHIKLVGVHPCPPPVTVYSLDNLHI